MQRPIPPTENLRKIDEAKDLILRELDRRASVSLSELRALRVASPAALNSAVIILKGERRIRTARGGVLRRAAGTAP